LKGLSQSVLRLPKTLGKTPMALAKRLAFAVVVYLICGLATLTGAVLLGVPVFLATGFDASGLVWGILVEDAGGWTFPLLAILGAVVAEVSGMNSRL